MTRSLLISPASSPTHAVSRVSLYHISFPGATQQMSVCYPFTCVSSHVAIHVKKTPIKTLHNYTPSILQDLLEPIPLETLVVTHAQTGVGLHDFSVLTFT